MKKKNLTVLKNEEPHTSPVAEELIKRTPMEEPEPGKQNRGSTKQ